MSSNLCTNRNIAVMFDMGGVLFLNGTKIAQAKMLSLGASKLATYEIFYGEDSWKLREGKISSGKYWQMIKKSFPYEFELNPREIWLESYCLNNDLMNFATLLHKYGYTIGIVSGNTTERVNYLKKKYRYCKNFDYEFYTFNLGVSKIDPKLYQKVIKEIGFEPQNIILVDDKNDCLDVAAQLNIHGIKHTSNNVTIAKLIDQLNGLQRFNAFPKLKVENFLA